MWQTSFVPDEWSDRRDALPQGCVLRDYTIQEVLGHGGFGIVYKACHNELDHVVAIKEYLPSELAVREGTSIRAKSADCETHFADGLRRFREEAKALIDFQQHPSVVDCRDFFRANGTAYLVMEYVEGLPLSELLRQREAAGQPFTESDLLGIAIPLGQGLAHIHSAGVIHRDIKLANILVRESEQHSEGGHDVDPPDPVSEAARTGRYSAGPSWKIVSVAAAIAAAVALSACSLIPREENAAAPERWGLSVEAEPTTATVALLNGPEAYRPGMLLVPGQYEIHVSAPGFVTSREWVRHLESDTLHRSELEPLPDAGSEPSRASDASEPVATEKVVAVAQVKPDTDAGLSSGCSGGDFRDCFELGDAYRTGHGVPLDYTRAAEYYEVACDGGHADSCRRLRSLGFQYRDGDGVPQDLARAAELYQQACDGGDARACWLVGYMHYEGNGVPIDHVRAARFYQVACDGGHSPGCRSLGSLYQHGKGVTLNHGRAAALYRRACDGGNASGCWNLGSMYQRGEGVPLDRARAAKLYERACDGGSAYGCYRLALMYQGGEGVTLDRARAAELYRRACDGDDMSGCRNLGWSYYYGHGVGQAKSVAASLFRKACGNGDQKACEALETLNW